VINENFSEKIEMIETLVRNIFWQMDADRKAKALKQLQGNIWKNAYEQGLVKGQ
jgi:methionine salvage enolase-phosphatase E1